MNIISSSVLLHTRARNSRQSTSPSPFVSKCDKSSSTWPSRRVIFLTSNKAASPLSNIRILSSASVCASSEALSSASLLTSVNYSKSSLNDLSFVCFSASRQPSSFFHSSKFHGREGESSVSTSLGCACACACSWRVSSTATMSCRCRDGFKASWRCALTRPTKDQHQSLRRLSSTCLCNIVGSGIQVSMLSVMSVS